MTDYFSQLKTLFRGRHAYWNIALHSVIAFLGQSTMQVVDLLFCRSLGSKASATVGTGSSLFAWFLIIGIGLFSSLEYFIPHAIGEKDEVKANSYFYSGVGVVLIVSAFSALGLFILSSLTVPLGFNPEIALAVKTFGSIMALCYLPVFLAPVLRIELQTRGFPHDTTLAFLWGNILNVFLNWVLVLGHLGMPALGTTGSAWASVLSRYGILIYLLYRVYRVRSKVAIPIAIRDVPFRACSKEIFRLGMPISLHMLFEMGAFIFVSTLAARLVATQNAAHAIVLSLASFSFMIPLGISSAASLTMSKANGEQNPIEAVLLGKMSIHLGLISAFISSVAYILFSRLILTIYTNDPETIRVGSKLLIIVAVFQFGDALQVILSGCLRGFAQTKIQAQMNAIGHWVIGIPLGVFLGFTLKMEIVGLWIGLCTGLWVVALSLLFWWRKTALRYSVQTL